MKKKSKVIFFSGPDGAGKTTTFLWTEGIIKQQNAPIFRLRSYQIGLITILKFRKKLRGQKVSGIQNVGRLGYSDIKRNRDNGKISWKIRRIIGLVTGIIDINIIGRLFVWNKKRKGYVVLVEESPLDIFVKRHRPQIKFIENSMARFFPKPNLSILCKADPDAIYNRKPELNKEEIVDYYMRIEELYSKADFKKKDIRTDVDMQQTQERLETLVNTTLNT